MAKEPAEVEPTSTRPLRPTETFMEYLARRAAEPQRLADRTVEIMMRQVDAILTADTAEEMWHADDFESLGGRNLEDVEQRILGFDVNPATDRYKAPLKHFYVIESARLSDGETFIWNTSAPLLMAKIRWLEAHNQLSTPVVIKGTDTPNGTVLKLEEIPKRPVQATAS